MEGFSKPDFWIWMGAVFGVNAVAFAALGAAVPAVFGAVTAFLALLSAALLEREADHAGPSRDGFGGPLQGP